MSRSKRRKPRTLSSRSHGTDATPKEHPWPKKAFIVIAAIAGIGIGSLLDLGSNSMGLRRSLATNSTRYLHTSHSTLLPWAHYNLRSVHERPSTDETALFWHIPKSGGTTAKRLYECLGQTLANRIGGDPRYGHHDAEEIIVFLPFENNPDAKFVNVDTTSKNGILRAEKLGLVASKKVDMIFTSDVSFAIDHLFDRDNKGRVFALFRHPVDRSVSKFYYLQTATWERTYRPEWKDMSIIEWATNHNQDENFMVKKIVGKKLSEEVDMSDLIIAKEIVRRRFIVGLMTEMEESIRRFNVILGIDETKEKNRLCMEEFFGPHDVEEEDAPNEEDDTSEEDTSKELDEKAGSEESNEIDESKEKASDKKNSNEHPKVLEGSPEWELLAERNSLDMLLYNYILLLWEEQKHIIESYRQEEGGEAETSTE